MTRQLGEKGSEIMDLLGEQERGQGTISDFIPVHLPATNDKAIRRKGQ
jgi:hypothetical protein